MMVTVYEMDDWSGFRPDRIDEIVKRLEEGEK